MDLQRRNAFLAGQHQIDDLEPNTHRNIGIFEDRSNQDRKAISLRRTGWAFPFEWHSFQRIDAVTPAVRATKRHLASDARQDTICKRYRPGTVYQTE
jgi:hypothetical protein